MLTLVNKYTLEEYIETINRALLSYIKNDNATSLGEEKMRQAMLYSVENGGKRIRPVLTLEFCRLCGGDIEMAMPLACAIEFIHTYSLIHDDLPCMDNDDMRRGKPASHIQFGEANALLAGDSLLTIAFETVASADKLDSSAVVKATAVLAKAAGCAGMIAGQVLDLENEDKIITVDDLRQVDNLKTGELIRAACVLGCVAANAKEQKYRAAQAFADNLGLAFQIVDDILDVTSNEETLGKPIGSDAENNKNTYVSLLGLENAKNIANELTENAISSLSVFGEDADFLIELSKKLLSRSN